MGFRGRRGVRLRGRRVKEDAGGRRWMKISHITIVICPEEIALDKSHLAGENSQRCHITKSLDASLVFWAVRGGLLWTDGYPPFELYQTKTYKSR